MSTVHSQPPSGNAVGRLLRSAWRYKGLIVAAVLLGALLGYGWAARQPTHYEGVTRVVPMAGSGSTSLAGEAPQPPDDPAQYVRKQAQFISSSVVLERAVKRSGSRISAETLGQRLEVEAAQDADLITIRVVDSTATGAAQLANTVAAAYQDVLAQQLRERSRQLVSQLRSTRSRLRATLAEINADLARDPADSVLQARRAAVAEQLSLVQRRLAVAEATAERGRPSLFRDPPTVPNQPIPLRPGRAMAIGMLLGLLASAVLVWWRTRRQGPRSGSATPEPGPEMPSPA
jgi:uncharacterized protein involved in exopolysaccharide biosynthesis